MIVVLQKAAFLVNLFLRSTLLLYFETT